MAKLAVDLQRALADRAAGGIRGATTGTVVASGDGWSVEDVICTLGPRDRPFEERHADISIAIVVAGTFQYRSALGRELMSPGSLLLGNAGERFECGHEHGCGDRCIAFRYSPAYFDTVASAAGAARAGDGFRAPRLPSGRATAALVARAATGFYANELVDWEAIGLELAAAAARAADGVTDRPRVSDAALARVTRIVRAIERSGSERLTLATLAKEAEQSPYHFLRTFEQVTGETPHQYVRRVRLREAALRLTLEPAKVIEIVFECGFGDVSSFNRAFRAEFGMSPRAYRARSRSPRVPLPDRSS